MTDRILDLRLFRYALASAEHGSFRRAAIALNIQQSTVSRGVRNLEHRVGADLFERGHAGIQLTPAGEQFFLEATLGFDHLERAMERAEAMHRGEQGELTVGVSVPFRLPSDLVQRFREAYRGVAIEIIECTTNMSWSLVQQRKVDVAFTAKIQSNGFPSFHHLGDERMMVVLPMSHSLAGARSIKLEDLRAERIILSTSGLGPDIRVHLERRMAKLGLEPQIQLHRVGQCDLITMVAREFGVTIVVSPHSRSTPNDVVFVPLTGRNVVPVYAIWMESNPNPALKGLLDILRKPFGPDSMP